MKKQKIRYTDLSVPLLIYKEENWVEIAQKSSGCDRIETTAASVGGRKSRHENFRPPVPLILFLINKEKERR